MEDVLQLLISGLAYGSIYALVALGFVLVYNAVGVVNFAQGEFVMVPSFIAVVLISRLGLPFWLAYPATAAAAILFGLLFQRVAYYPLRNRSFIPVIISTIGASILLQNGAQVIFGSEPINPPALFASGETISVLGVRVVPQYLLILGVTLVMVIFQYVLFEKTLLGKQLLATAQDRQTARLMGIHVNQMIALTFAYSAVLGAIAGILVGPLLLVSKTMGTGVALKAFCASIVGGFGSVQGAIVGGLFLGIVEKIGARYISSAYEQGFAFMILIAVLLLRPQGLFGEKIAEKA